ncbi:MAG: hypothetical protein ABIM98_09155 [candidate division WOR-3 bacterium]
MKYIKVYDEIKKDILIIPIDKIVLIKYGFDETYGETLRCELVTKEKIIIKDKKLISKILREFGFYRFNFNFFKKILKRRVKNDNKDRSEGNGGQKQHNSCE